MDNLYLLDIKKKKYIKKCNIIYLERPQKSLDNFIQSEKKSSIVDIYSYKDITKKSKIDNIKIVKTNEIDILEKTDTKQINIEIQKLPNNSLLDNNNTDSDNEYVGIIPIFSKYDKKTFSETKYNFKYYLESYHLLLAKKGIIKLEFDNETVENLGYKKFIRNIIDSKFMIKKKNIKLIKFYMLLKNIHIYIVVLDNLDGINKIPNEFNINSLYTGYYWRIVDVLIGINSSKIETRKIDLPVDDESINLITIIEIIRKLSD